MFAWGHRSSSAARITPNLAVSQATLLPRARDTDDASNASGDPVSTLVICREQGTWQKTDKQNAALSNSRVILKFKQIVKNASALGTVSTLNFLNRCAVHLCAFAVALGAAHAAVLTPPPVSGRYEVDRTIPLPIDRAAAIPHLLVQTKPKHAECRFDGFFISPSRANQAALKTKVEEARNTGAPVGVAFTRGDDGVCYLDAVEPANAIGGITQESDPSGPITIFAGHSNKHATAHKAAFRDFGQGKFDESVDPITGRLSIVHVDVAMPGPAGTYTLSFVGLNDDPSDGGGATTDNTALFDDVVVARTGAETYSSPSGCSFTAGPTSLSANQSGTFSVSCSAGSGPLTYEWSKNGAAIGGNNASITDTPFTAADAATLASVTYVVVIRNAAGITPLTREVANASYTGGSTSSDKLIFIHPDVKGSPLMATDANGTALWRELYSAFGVRRKNEGAANAGSAANSLWYIGKPQDNATGLVYFGARWYDPQVGRFMGFDPAGVDEDNPHSFNRYAYGNNNPYKYLDPDGRLPILIPLVVVAWRAYSAYDTISSASGNISTLASSTASTGEKIAAGAELAGSLVGGKAGRNAASGVVGKSGSALPMAPSSVNIAAGKFGYMFGHVSSGTHNAARSAQLATTMKSLGVSDSPAGHKFLSDHFAQVANTPGNISRTFSTKHGNFETRESLFVGPSGKAVKFETTFKLEADGSRSFSTTIPKE